MALLGGTAALIGGLTTIAALPQIVKLFEESKGSRARRGRNVQIRAEAFLTRRLLEEERGQKSQIDPGVLLAALTNPPRGVSGFGNQVAEGGFGGSSQVAPTPAELETSALGSIARNASVGEVASISGLGGQIEGLRPETLAIFQSALVPQTEQSGLFEPPELSGNPFEERVA